MNRAEQAANLLATSQMNCAQAVLTAFADELGLDKDSALRVSQAFGAGMGRTGGMCGAVTGAYMAIRLRPYEDLLSPLEKKERVYALVAQFNERFKALHNSLSCSELLGHDLSTPEGRAAAKETRAGSKICPALVADAVTILETLSQ